MLKLKLAMFGSKRCAEFDMFNVEIHFDDGNTLIKLKLISALILAEI